MTPEELSALINTLSEARRLQLQAMFVNMVQVFLDTKIQAVFLTSTPCADDPEGSQMLRIHGINATREAVEGMMLHYLAHACADDLLTPDETMRH